MEALYSSHTRGRASKGRRITMIRDRYYDMLVVTRPEKDINHERSSRLLGAGPKVTQRCWDPSPVVPKAYTYYLAPEIL